MYYPRSSSSSLPGNEHEGIYDIIVCKHAEDMYSSMPFVIRVNYVLKEKMIGLIVNGKETGVTMRVNERNEGCFLLSQQEVAEQVTKNTGLERLSEHQSGGTLLLTQVAEVLISICAEGWSDSWTEDEKEVKFNQSIVSENEYISSNESIVGKDRLMYRINGKYYRENEAWRVILGYKLCGTNVLQNKGADGGNFVDTNGSGSQRILSDGEKLVSAYRPSSEQLKRMNLRLGENDLTYEFYLDDTVKETRSVKIFLYDSSAKLIISDIDGTITK